MTTFHDTVRIQGLRLAGWLLIVLPLLGMVVLAHHPTAQGHDLHDLQQQLQATATPSKIVHGALMLMQCGLVFALLTWLQARDFRRALPRGAALMLVFGSLGLMGAALVDGFVIALPATYAQGDATGLLIMDQQVHFAAALLLAAAVLGEVALSLGYLLLSLDLWSLRTPERIVGVIGVLVSIVALAGFFSGTLTLRLHGMQILYAAQSVWMIGLGVIVLRQRASATD